MTEPPATSSTTPVIHPYRPVGPRRHGLMERMGEHEWRVKRAYDPPEDTDGCRVLVDRLWPRGISKQAARLDEWLKDLTVSNELRRWYHEDMPHRHAEFVRRYRRELEGPRQTAALDRLRTLGERGPVTLVTAAKDVEHSQVPVLLQSVTSRAGNRPRGG